VAGVGDVLHDVRDRPRVATVQILGSTTHPDELFMRQAGRTLTAADDEQTLRHRVLICDRDAKWSPVRQLLADVGYVSYRHHFGRPTQTPTLSVSYDPSRANASTA
jgi:hypothetical protein